jgi:glycerol uptake facilitator-like aquaporin
MYVCTIVSCSLICILENQELRSKSLWCMKCRGQQPASPGCYDPNPALTGVETWAWETILTFVLIYVVYATAIASPGHGSLSPLAIGLTVYVGAVAGTWVVQQL